VLFAIVKLESKWVVDYRWELIRIFIVFAITGSSSVKIAKPLLELMGVEMSAFENIFLGSLLYWILRILVVFPIYQILLLFFGTIFFQFKFFWKFEKKILSRMGFKRFFRES
jgi:hypothetical protein